ncbi:MAG: ABC transporter permease [Candidatus Caldarchaeum sp.]|nr:ABC transporter permease [Candidatus Caldarchaeum sp.]MDW8359272.1 ABC transporter permease [Candidatus Caldarchaeum sp.]
MKLWHLLHKEIRELFNEKTILLGVLLTPLLIFPIMGMAFTLASSGGGGELSRPTLLVIDRDGGRYAAILTEALKTAGFRTTVADHAERDVVELIKEHRPEAALVLRNGFTLNLTRGKTGLVELYVLTASVSMTELQKTSTIQKLVSDASAAVGEALAAEMGIAVSFYKQPITVAGGLVYRDKVVASQEFELLFQQYLSTTLFVPIILLMVVVTSGTVAATSVGLEKEAKTLELLLTLPISRLNILASKLLGSTIIALLGTSSMMAGLYIYFTGLTTASGMNLGIHLQPPTFAFLAVVLFVAMVATLCLGILAGVLSGDVRGGQQLASLIQIPLILPPFFVLVLADFSSIPQPYSTILLLNPFTHIIIALQHINEGAYASSIVHISVMVLFTGLVLALASWLFRGERLLTMRIRLGRRSGGV